MIEAVGGSARVFFALWPDELMAARQERLAQACLKSSGGRGLRRESLHLTLAFVGTVGVERLPQLQSIGADVAYPAFAFNLDLLGFWPHNNIVWAGLRESSPALAGLAERLAQALASSGFQLERRAFFPHVTLLRDALLPPAPELNGPGQWQASEFRLVQSVTGRGDYRILGRWPLQSS